MASSTMMTSSSSRSLALLVDEDDDMFTAHAVSITSCAPTSIAEVMAPVIKEPQHDDGDDVDDSSASEDGGGTNMTKHTVPEQR